VGITTSGDLYCWGWNSKNQLGNPSGADPCTNGNGTLDSQCSFHPLRANGVSNVTAMDVGLEHTCALTVSKQMLCWGDNAHGELGDATGVPQTAPVVVHGQPAVSLALVFSNHPASASAAALTGSGSSVVGASHSLPHLRHFRKSPRAFVNFISAPT